MTALSLDGQRNGSLDSSVSGLESSPDSPPRPPAKPALARSSSYTSTRASASHAQLYDKFAELRDGIYYSATAASFVLSADEKFAFTNVQLGQPPQEPVEIDDVEEFFKVWDCWDETFSRRLDFTEYPAIRLSRSRQSFRGMRLGVLAENGRKTLFDARGELILAQKTRKYLGGVVWLTDLGDFEDVQRQERDELLKSFETICDSLPHMVWTATAEGVIDYFSRSWYENTGRNAENSLGHGWRDGIHPDDVPEVWAAFGKAMAFGTEEETQYRYRQRDGGWRWMAVGFRSFSSQDDRSGKILTDDTGTDKTEKGQRR